MPTRLGWDIGRLSDFELAQVKDQIIMEQSRRKDVRIAQGKYDKPFLTGDRGRDVLEYHRTSYGNDMEMCEKVIAYEYAKREEMP